MKKLTQRILLLIATTCSLGFIMAPTLAFAAPDCSNPADSSAAVLCGVTSTGTEKKCTDKNAKGASLGGSCIDNTVNNVIDIFSVVVGLVAVIMIMVGGFKYVTSGGESAQVSSAKNTILYAVVGLIVVALAQIIVRYVLNHIN